MSITEPATMLTDYLITLFCFVIVWRLRGRCRVKGTRIWRLGFLTLGIAALTGGTFHGFRLWLGDSGASRLWDATMVLIGFSGGFMVSGSLASSAATALPWLLRGVAITFIGLVVMIVPVSPHEQFNQNDLFHCIFLVALYFLYQGSVRLDEPDAQPRVGDSAIP